MNWQRVHFANGHKLSLSFSLFFRVPKGCKIHIDEENVQSILQASAFLQCASAEKASSDFMLANLSLSNAYSIFLLALSCGSAYLAEATEAFILSSVRSLRLSMASVMDLLQMDLELIKGTSIGTVICFMSNGINDRCYRTD